MKTNTKTKEEVGKLIIGLCKITGVSALIFKTKKDGYDFNIIFEEDDPR